MNDSRELTDDETSIQTFLSPEEEEEERKHLQKIITALRCYRKYAYVRVNKRENFLCTLPKRHQHMLSKYRQHLDVLRDCIDANQSVINEMLRYKVPCADVTEVESSLRAKGDNERPATRIGSQDIENVGNK